MPKIKERIEPIPDTFKTLADERVLEVMNYVLSNAINGVTMKTQFLRSIKYGNTSNLQAVIKGTQSFKNEHLEALCAIYKVDANFLFVKKYNNMFLQESKGTPMDRLKIAVKEVELFIKGKEV